MSARAFASDEKSDRTKALYIAEFGPGKGASPVLLGLFNHLSRSLRVSYFQAISSRAYSLQGEEQGSRHVQLMRSAFRLISEPSSMVGLGVDQARDMLANKKGDQLVNDVLERYQDFSKDKEFTMIYGGRLGDLDLECQMANTFGAPMVLIINAPAMSPKQIVDRVMNALAQVRRSPGGVHYMYYMYYILYIYYMYYIY